jgi:hypothetical protein
VSQILIANTSEEAGTFNKLLSGHDLTFANTLAAATSYVERTEFDLIIATVHFDGSRMFDFLRIVHQSKFNAEKPIICFSLRNTDMTRLMHENLHLSTEALGAWIYLDEHTFKQFKEPAAALRRIVERCLSGQRRHEILRKRIGIHKERQEIHQLRPRLGQITLTPETQERNDRLRSVVELLQQSIIKLDIAAHDQRAHVKLSRNAKDRIAQRVETAENNLTEMEELQSFQETLQKMNEQTVSGREDIRRGAPGTVSSEDTKRQSSET